MGQPEQKLALWTGPDGYTYFVVRLHDDDENRLKRIEAELQELKRRLDGLNASDLHTASSGSS